VHVEDLYTLRGDWSEAEVETIQQAILDMGRAYQRIINEYVNQVNFQNRQLVEQFGMEAEILEWLAPVAAAEAFQQVHGGPITLRRSDQTCQEARNDKCDAFVASSREILFYQREKPVMVRNPDTGKWEPEMREIINEAGEAELVPVTVRENVNIAGKTHFLVHEFGHTFESRVNVRLQNREEISVRNTLDAHGGVVARTQDKLPDLIKAGDPDYGFAGPFPGWQQSRAPARIRAPGEEVADMMIGWVYGQWAMEDGVLTPQGEARSNFMQRHMPEWVLVAAGYIPGR
jgi:hypothetical protein